jgi:hypothetical protein
MRMLSKVDILCYTHFVLRQMRRRDTGSRGTYMLTTRPLLSQIKDDPELMLVLQFSPGNCNGVRSQLILLVMFRACPIAVPRR